MNKYILGGIGFLLFCAVFYLYKNYNPTEVAFYPTCPSKFISKYDCPGCGSQRATHALLNGRLDKAFSFNPLFVLVLPYVFVLALFEYVPALKTHKFRGTLNHRYASITLFVIVIIFTIWRNI